MQGDRSHFYDQLLDRSWPVKRVVTASYALAAVFAVMGFLAISLRTRYMILLYSLAVACVIALVAKFGMVRLSDEMRVSNDE